MLQGGRLAPSCPLVQSRRIRTWRRNMGAIQRALAAALLGMLATAPAMAAVLLGGLAPAPARAGVPVLPGARPHTRDTARPRAEAMAFDEGGGLLATGPAGELGKRSPGARRLDVGGATVVPGLIDAHAH